jgi:glutamate-1-semialdehyde 2,1-aminomutase
MPEDSLFEAYRKTHTKSASFHEEAKQYFAGDGATAHTRIIEPYRPFITHAKGSKKWDVDGNEYVDYTMGHGALLLGHSHPAVVSAIQEQAAKGLHYGDSHELEIRWAELIAGMVPAAERIEFFSCGQEANLMAIRLSRAFTGRRKILRFKENFHGWADQFSLPPMTAGAVFDDVTLIPYDLEIAEKELATHEYAILMTEGGGAHMAGQIPLDEEFVRALPDLANKYGTIWHMDEVVTGFRDHVGGYQSMVGVKPDLASFGKIVTGGLAGGVLVGRADILHAFSADMPNDKRVKHSGTWNGNPLTCSAGIACLNIVKTGEPQKQANELAAAFKEKGRRMMKDGGFDAWLYGRSIVHVYLGPIDFEPDDDISPPTFDLDNTFGKLPQKERLCIHLLQRGISTLSARYFVMSAVHTEEDIDKTVNALKASLEAMREEGTL